MAGINDRIVGLCELFPDCNAYILASLVNFVYNSYNYGLYESI